ncbi:hypothetical protein G5V59_09910 [Nocardioides sp. W3-2-3]|nr:hypothetical protein [Nocardioides convexus]
MHDRSGLDQRGRRRVLLDRERRRRRGGLVEGRRRERRGDRGRARGPATGSEAVAMPLALVVALTDVPPDREKVTVRFGSTDADRFGSVSVARTVTEVFCAPSVAPE